MTNHLPPELPELHELPTLPPRVYAAYVLSVCGSLAASGAAGLAGIIGAGGAWALLASGAFFLLAVSQVLAYLWRSEAWEAHTMAVALSRAVAWIYSDERPEL
jgi:hypothetical protein